MPTWNPPASIILTSMLLLGHTSNNMSTPGCDLPNSTSSLVAGSTCRNANYGDMIDLQHDIPRSPFEQDLDYPKVLQTSILASSSFRPRRYALIYPYHSQDGCQTLHSWVPACTI
ncbi:hypothetical protein N7509_000205 [Penicillium cosmopolitanum]|uniref:Uncharacterized protein n=1 Tax=Penicillium cosmopolitanum TaxID=1131564 RepID=A0A9X0BF35_9EURO|nr:uncharacterized protein N7509_000205 [Penicillium cosmopolitanum]KAJ5414871.1 hypothetical protein N7509_000205 [Penicillium cosmopolitanum]